MLVIIIQDTLVTMCYNFINPGIVGRWLHYSFLCSSEIILETVVKKL
jgi:hypothetical protein